ncbi:N-acetylneuraminate synthase family protein [Cognatiyoonia sp. IB215446]|uniref:N-acetylneuraminate synthase family protein n=1 Tax=Cognatiyoonia sp. IB215446 TaxID=3097355 RepID=UPI002A0E3FE7|nr:N-acetylneuraminate synthase family protein [Cognatiyoonia sp. IB215446]MDX8349285.1 N-acetylneuraminate synthase family protein [Cognatiyoonia sp. IB215446]
MNKTFEIGDRTVGDGQSCYLIAEIGSNHNQDWDLALRLIDAAAEAGADAVKFQTFKSETHVSKFAKMPSYLMEGESIQELLKTLELDREWQKPLQTHAHKRGVHFFSSPCDIEAVDLLAEIGAPAMKVASFDLPDLRLIRHIAKTQVPVILSTGMADWMDIQRAIDVCEDVGNPNIVLLQCTSLYPAPVELSNLRAMTAMRNTFDVLTGYSDHTLGDTVSCAAVAMGACMIEKHFTLDRTLDGPDHSFAMEPAEFAEMVTRIRATEAAFGDGAKNGPRGPEVEMADKVRRSTHAERNIAKGERITEDMLVIKRPGKGIPPHLIDQVIGRTARQDIQADQWIEWSMI